MDLTCLYLLESRHFYFSAFQTSADSNDDMAHAGFQLRNLEKLLRAGEISRKQHQRFILPLMLNRKNEISQLNGEYKRTSDYIKIRQPMSNSRLVVLRERGAKYPTLRFTLMLN